MLASDTGPDGRSDGDTRTDVSVETTGTSTVGVRTAARDWRRESIRRLGHRPPRHVDPVGTHDTNGTVTREDFPFPDRLKLDVAGGPTISASNPWNYIRRYDREIEGLKPPVWVVVFADNVDSYGSYDQQPPDGQPKQAFEIRNGDLVTIPDGTEPTNDVYIVVQSRPDRSVFKFVAEEGIKNNAFLFGNRTLIGNTDGASPQTFVINRSDDTPGLTPTFQAPSEATIGEPATFDASPSRVDNGSIELYEWDFDGDGVYDATGRTTTHTFSETGFRRVTLRVTDDQGRTDTRVETVPIVGTESNTSLQADIQVRPAEPRTNETVILDGSESSADNGTINNYTWTVAPLNRPLTGETVATELPAGQHDVLLQVRGPNGSTATALETVGVRTAEGANVTIDAVEHDRFQPLINDYVFNDTYRVSLTAAEPIDRVVFEIGGRQYVDRDGTDGWSKELPLRWLQRDRPLTVTAYAESGATATETVQVDILDLPGWVVTVGNTGTVRYDDGLFRARVVAPKPPVDVSPRVPEAIPVIGGAQKLEARGKFGVVYDVPRSVARPSASGKLKAKLLGKGATGKIGGEGRIKIRGDRWDLQRGQVFVAVKISAISRSYTPGIPYSPTVSFKLKPKGELTVFFEDDPDGGLRVVRGRVEPGITGKAKLVAGIGFAEAGASGTAELTGSVSVPEPYRPSLSAEVEGTVWVSAWWLSKSYQFGPYADSVRLAEASAGEVGWRVRPVRGQRPLPTLAGDGVSAATVGTATTDAGRLVRLTDDRLEDDSPAFGVSNGTVHLVWSRHTPGTGPLDGRDVYARSRVDGQWTTPIQVTNDSRFQVGTAVAGAPTNRSLAAWTVLDRTVDDETARNVTDLSTVNDDAEIEVAVRTASGWSAPRTLTNDTTLDFGTSVTRGADGWLVAWTRDADANLTTVTDRSVRLVRLNETGAPIASTTIGNASLPTLASDATGDPQLTYLAPAASAAGPNRSVDGTNGTVTVARVDVGGDRNLSVSTTATSRATGVRDVASAGGRTVWAGTHNGSAAVLEVDADGTGDPLGVAANVSDVRSVRLVDVNGTPVVTYRGRRVSDGRPTLRYAAYNGSDWVGDRAFALGPSDNATFHSPALVAAPTATDAFRAAFVGEPVAVDARGDVFTTTRRLASDPAVTDLTVPAVGANETVRPGENATVAFRLRNRGARATTDDLRVALVADGTVVNATTVGSLASGVTTTGRLSGPVGTDGRLAVRVVSTVDQATTANDRRSVALAAPDVAVSNVTARRVGDRLVLGGTITNSGPAAAENVTFAFASNGTVLANGSLAALAPNASRRVVTAADAAPLEGGRVSFVATVTGPVADRDTTDNVVAARPLRPDLTVLGGAVTYRPRGDGRRAVAIPVANRGRAAANATVRVFDPAANRTLAARTTRVSAPPPGAAAAFTTVRVTLSERNASSGDRLLVSATTPFERDPTDNADASVVSLTVDSPFPNGLPGGSSTRPPADVDADGRLEDLNGDGRVSFVDVIEFAFALQRADYSRSARTSAQIAALDHSGDGRVSFVDVIDLVFEL